MPLAAKHLKPHSVKQEGLSHLWDPPATHAVEVQRRLRLLRPAGSIPIVG